MYEVEISSEEEDIAYKYQFNNLIINILWGGILAL